MKQAMKKTLVHVIGKEEEFTFRLYIHTPPGVTLLALCTDRNRQILLSRRDNLEHLDFTMVAVVAPVMLPFKLESARAYSFTAPRES